MGLDEQRTCFATTPPIWVLSFTNLSTDEFKKLSKSSIDSGSSS
jgi:hypothetical protein